MERGQISSYDALAALFLFLLAFTTLRGTWLGNLEVAENELEYNDMRSKAIQAIDSLVKTKGSPSDWNSENVELIGLAEKPSVLSESKLREFSSMSYTTVKELLWLGNYDFRFELYAAEPSKDLNVGMPVDGNSTIVSLRRTINYLGGQGLVVFKVFKE